MSDNAESPIETPKEESHPPADDSATSDDKKKNRPPAPLPREVLDSLMARTKDFLNLSVEHLLVDVLLKAVGDTPIMKTKKWAVDRVRTVQSLSQFISRFLKLDGTEQLFIYVNQSFAPSPDQEVGTLFDCFGSDNKLILHYCKSQAWG